MLTGKPMEENVTFTRKLLAQYSTEYGLHKYIRYFEMKKVITEIEDACKKAAKGSGGSSKKGETAPATSPTATTTAITVDETKLSDFFRLLNDSYKTVNLFATERDAKILERIKHIRSLTTSEIIATPFLLEDAYTEIRAQANYRDLNCEALRKILKKFIERVCLRWAKDYALQERILKIDKVIAASSISEAPYDISEGMDYIVSAHALCFSCTFEQSTQHMVRHVNSILSMRPRIAPISSAYFFQQRMPHRFAQGSFAVRIVAGNSNPKLAKVIGQVMQGKFAVKCNVSQFANGEVSVAINEAVRGDDCFIVQSINSNDSSKKSASTILMELLLLLQTARLASCARMTAVIPYFAYTSSPMDGAAIAEMIVKMGCSHVVTVDMPNAQVEGFFGNVPVENLTARFEFIRFVAENLRAEEHDFRNIVCVAPTGDTVNNARKFADSLTKYVLKRNLHHPVGATSSPMSSPHPPAARKAVDGSIIQSFAIASQTPKASDAAVEKAVAKLAMHQQQHHDQLPQFVVDVATAVERCVVSPTTAKAPSSSSAQSPYRNASSSAVVEVIGHVGPESLCIITAHVIDDVSALVRVAEKLAGLGCKRIKLVGTHALFSGTPEVIQQLADAPIEEVLITDSIHRDGLLYHGLLAKKIRILPVGPLLAEAIQRIHTGNSLSTLFEK